MSKFWVYRSRCDTEAPLGNLYRQAARVGYLDRTRQFQVLDQRFGPNTACYRELWQNIIFSDSQIRRWLSWDSLVAWEADKRCANLLIFEKTLFWFRDRISYDHFFVKKMLPSHSKTLYEHAVSCASLKSCSSRPQVARMDSKNWSRQHFWTFRFSDFVIEFPTVIFSAKNCYSAIRKHFTNMPYPVHRSNRAQTGTSWLGLMPRDA